jgi:hypothetical protein
VSLFDDNVDALGIVEDHAAAVLELQDAQARKILGVYQQVATKLRRRLRALPGDSFSAQQVRVTLMQIDGAIHALGDDLYDAVDLGSTLMAKRGIRDLVAEADAFNDEFAGAMQPVSIDLVQVALDTKARLINRYQASIDAYSAGLRKAISDNMMSMVVERVGPEVMYQRLVEDDGIGKFFEGESWKVRRIVRTELHGMYNYSKLAGIGRYAEDNEGMRKALFNPKDSRTGDDSRWVIARQEGGRLNTATYNLRPEWDEPFFYTWTTKSGKKYRRVFMAPPDRPNDRAALIPYHPSWGD